jgi:hypothetical protein
MEARLVGIQLLTETIEFWRRWLSKCRYDGRWRETVNRSALMLKLLTFAPTCGLREYFEPVAVTTQRITPLTNMFG